MKTMGDILDHAEVRASNACRQTRPLRNPRVLAGLLALLGIFIGLTLGKAPWQQSASGHGRVFAFSPDERVQNLDAPLDGRISRWFVQEGDIVNVGDPVVELLDNDPELLERLQREQDAVKQRLAAAELAAKTAMLNVERQEKAVDRGLAAPREFEKARMEYAKHLSEEAKAAEDLAKVEVRLSRQGAQRVVSPMTARVQRRLSGEGGVLVKSGTTLAVLVPETDSRAVELLIDGNDIPLIHTGDEVRLQFEGWPALQVSGWPSVAVGTFPGIVRVVDTAGNGADGFRVIVTPRRRDDWPETPYLRQGTRAQGWILLREVKLGYELWRRFNGFPPSLPSEPGIGKKEAQK
jgi:biotin carboxyl carrier protein